MTREPFRPQLIRLQRSVVALVLAAGQGRRMGQLKQLMPYRNEAMVDAVISAVLESSVEGLSVVVNPAVERHLHDRLPEEDCLVVVNGDERSEMLSSVQLGLAAARREFELGDDDGLMILLADQPQVTTGIITTCAEAFRRPAQAPGILIATYKGLRGHPAIFRMDLLGEISAWGPERRLNELASLHAPEVRELAITMAPMPLDVNTPDDYQRLTERG